MEAPSCNVESDSLESNDPKESGETMDAVVKDESISMGVTSLIEKFEVEKTSDELTKQVNSKTSISPVRSGTSLTEKEEQACTPEKASMLSDTSTEQGAKPKETDNVKDYSSPLAMLDESKSACATGLRESSASQSSGEFSESSMKSSEGILVKIENKIVSIFENECEKSTDKSTSDSDNKSTAIAQPSAVRAVDIVSSANEKDALLDDSEFDIVAEIDRWSKSAISLLASFRNKTTEQLHEIERILSTYYDEMTSTNKIESISNIPDKESAVLSANICEIKEVSASNDSQDTITSANEKDAKVDDSEINMSVEAKQSTSGISIRGSSIGIIKELQENVQILSEILSVHEMTSINRELRKITGISNVPVKENEVLSSSICESKSSEANAPQDIVTSAKEKHSSADDSEVKIPLSLLKRLSKFMSKINQITSKYSDESTSSNEGISSILGNESEDLPASICQSTENSEANVLQDSTDESTLKLDKNIRETVIEILINADKKSEENANSAGQNVIKKQISLKKIEQILISALDADVPATESLPKDPNYMTVPDIKITDASDIEDSDTETLKDESEIVAVAEVEGKRKRKREESDKEHAEVDEKQEDGSSKDSQFREELSYEERRATFYISSSELQRDRMHETTAIPPETNERTRKCQEISHCLASKKLHGSIITSSIFVATIGMGLSNLARKGKAPDYFEIIGLSTTIISGIVGVLSLAYCCILTFLPSLCGNEPFTDIETVIPMYTPMLPDEYIHESLNSETERAFRRQNNMSSPRASAVPVRRQHRQADKIEKAKMEIGSAMKSLGKALNKLQTAEEREKQPLLRDIKTEDSSD